MSEVNGVGDHEVLLVGFVVLEGAVIDEELVEVWKVVGCDVEDGV